MNRVSEAAIDYTAWGFDFLTDLGTVVVPDDYDHRACLEKFAEKCSNTRKQKKTYEERSFTHDDIVNESTLRSATSSLERGAEYLVSAWKVRLFKRVRSWYILGFIEQRGGILVGAQGLVLVHEQKKDLLYIKSSEGYEATEYVSFDAEEMLPQNKNGYRGVPELTVFEKHGPTFCLGEFDGWWSGATQTLAVLVFTKK